MIFLDYVIIAVVAALFVLALIVYRKKPHCSCGESGGCCGDCSKCHSQCKTSANTSKCSKN